MDAGLKVGVEGEAEFKKQIREIDDSLKLMGAELKSVASEYDKNDKSAKNLTAQNEVLNREIDAQKDKLGLLKDKLAAAKSEYGESDAKTQQYQRAVYNATAELNKMERQVSDNDKNLGDHKITLGSVKDALVDFGKAAGAAIVGLATAGAGAATAIGAMTVKAGYAADDINTLAKQTGLSTDEIQKYQFAAEQIDVPLETITGSMAKLTKNMATAQDGTGAASDAFKKLGVSITDQNGELRNNQDVFDEAIKKLGTMKNETERDALSMQIFGKSAQDLNPLILGGADALKELGDQAESAGLILSGEQLDKLNSVSDAMDTFKATASGSGSLFSTAFAGPLSEGINTVTGYMQRLSKSFAEGGFDALSEEMGTVLTDVISKVNEYLPQIVQFGSDIILQIVQGIVTMLPDIAATAVTIITQLTNSLAEMLPTLIPIAIDAILTIVDTLLENLTPLIDAALNIIESIAMGLIEALPKLAEKVPEIIIKIVQVITENLPKIIELALTLIVELAKGLIIAIPELVKAIPDIITAIVDGFGESASKILDIGKRVVEGVWEGIKNAESWVKEKINGFFGGIVDGVKDFLGIKSPSRVFAGIGGYMAEGLGNGFTREMNTVAKQIQGSIPTDVEMTGSYTATARMGEGIVNGLSSIMQGGAMRLEVPIYLNGREIARGSLDDLISVGKQRGVAFSG